MADEMTETIREVRLDEVFTVTLTEKASAGYLWELLSGDKFDMIGVRIVLNDTQGRHEVIGGWVTKVYSLRAKVAGEFDLDFVMKRPWEKNSNPIERYHEIISVLE